MLNCLNRFTYIILMASNCYEQSIDHPENNSTFLRTLQSSEWVKVMCEWMAWVGSGLMMTLLRDVERERERGETITLLSGMSARTGSGQSWAARSPSVLTRPVSQSTLLWISTATRGPGRSRELSSSSRARLPALVLTRPGRAGPGIASESRGPGGAARGRPGV